ncbi:MAG: flagellar hook-basal body complex protein FliE [Phycisphaerales bacterium]|jgi:flagellar hook-basal body complex protein FliE|nr:flagellar hook-basal body complex protein FliE [Phycisphaerales bacterium]
MSDPLGLIGNSVTTVKGPLQKQNPLGPPGTAPTGPEFKQVLQGQLDQVNQLQADATAAMEDLSAGRRDDIEQVMIATQKADTAFKMLLQVRNKVLEAYDEIKQTRV